MDSRPTAVTYQTQTTLRIETRGRGFIDVTDRLQRAVMDSGLSTGLATAFVRHTSASLLIQENADPDVQHDLERFLTRLAPDDSALYRHVSEGADDMPAHIRAALTQTSIAIPVASGRPLLGTWQGLYLLEHRTAPHRREVVLHIMGTQA